MSHGCCFSIVPSYDYRFVKETQQNQPSLISFAAPRSAILAVCPIAHTFFPLKIN
jgi:hypothetical protein